jgi:hypothetical protein
MLEGARKRPTFRAFQTAKDDAEVVVTRFGNASSDMLTLTSADRAAYFRTRQLADSVACRLNQWWRSLFDSSGCLAMCRRCIWPRITCN